MRVRDDRTRERDQRAYEKMKADPEKRRRKDERTHLWKRKNPKWRMIYNARMNAKRRGVPFDITIEDFEIPVLCPVLGIPLRIELPDGNQQHCPASPSLDRIIPSLGYVRGNVQVISNRANLLKNDGTADEHRKIAEYIERILR